MAASDAGFWILTLDAKFSKNSDFFFNAFEKFEVKLFSFERRRKIKLLQKESEFSVNAQYIVSLESSLAGGLIGIKASFDNSTVHAALVT